MHLVITISPFSLTQFQKTNNKDIQLPLKIKYKYIFLKAISSMNYQRKSCQKLSLTSKRKSQWQQVKIRWSKCPHQLALGKISSKRTTKSKNHFYQINYFYHQQFDQSFAKQIKTRVHTFELFRRKRQKGQVFKQDWKSKSSEIKLKKKSLITCFLSTVYPKAIGQA